LCARAPRRASRARLGAASPLGYDLPAFRSPHADISFSAGLQKFTFAPLTAPSEAVVAKFLLLLALGIVAYLIMSRVRRQGEQRQAERKPAPPPATTEDMVRCAVCGVHLPRSEGFASKGRFYCSDEHLRLSGRKGREDE